MKRLPLAVITMACVALSGVEAFADEKPHVEITLRSGVVLTCESVGWGRNFYYCVNGARKTLVDLAEVWRVTNGGHELRLR
jgi:hypothetical protein